MVKNDSSETLHEKKKEIDKNNKINYLKWNGQMAHEENEWSLFI